MKDDWTIIWIKWIYELQESGRPKEGLEEVNPTSDVGDDPGPERVGTSSLLGVNRPPDWPAWLL